MCWAVLYARPWAGGRCVVVGRARGLRRIPSSSSSPEFISCGCCKKLSQTSCLNLEMYSLTVLETRSSSSASLGRSQGVHKAIPTWRPPGENDSLPFLDLRPRPLIPQSQCLQPSLFSDFTLPSPWGSNLPHSQPTLPPSPRSRISRHLPTSTHPPASAPYALPSGLFQTSNPGS